MLQQWIYIGKTNQALGFFFFKKKKLPLSYTSLQQEASSMQKKPTLIVWPFLSFYAMYEIGMGGFDLAIIDLYPICNRY